MSLPLPMVTGYLSPQEISRMKRRGRLHHTRRRAMSDSRPVWFLDFQNRLRRMYTEASNLMLVKNAKHSGSLGQWSTGIVQESRWSPRCWLGDFPCWAPARHGCCLLTWTNKPSLAWPNRDKGCLPKMPEVKPRTLQLHPLLCKDFKIAHSDCDDHVAIRILDGISCYWSPPLFIAHLDLHPVWTDPN